MVTLTNMQEAVERVKEFVRKKNMHHVLEGFVSYMIPHRSDLKSVLTIGGGSYTDGREVVVGIPEWVFESPEEEIFLSIRALAVHECQHVNSSDFTLYAAYQQEMADWYAKHHPTVPQNVVLTAARYVGNGTEDGRIERIAVNRRPGTLRPIKFFRGIWWKNQPMQGESEFSEFLFSIVTLATMGLLPKEFETHWEGTRVVEQIDRLRPRINEAVMAVTSADHIEVCRNIMKEIAPYIKEMVDEMPPQMQQFANQEAGENPDYQSTPDNEETGEAGGNSTHYGEIDPNAKPQKGSGQGGQEHEDAEDQNDGEGGNGKEGGDQKDQPNGESSSQGQGEQNDEGKKEDGKNKKGNGEKEEKDSGSKKSDEDKVDDSMGADRDELFNDARNRIKKAMRDKVREERKNLEDHELDEQERDELLHRAGGDIRELIIQKAKTGRLEKAEASILGQGKKLRRDIEQILRNKEAMNLRNQKRGVIDPSNLYKVGMRDHNIFMQKGSRNDTEYAAFLLWDASGSMGERIKGVTKKESSSRAVAIAEEGLKGIVPFKIMQYTTSWQNVTHTVVKDFDQTDKTGNFAWTRNRSTWSMGGNRDGLAIRHASEELLKRAEKGKLLIIFSDGMPSAYRTDEEAKTDVQEAVKEARNAGIHVVTVLFGSEEQIDHLKDDFKYMYDRNIIFADPSNLTRHLSRTLKETLRR